MSDASRLLELSMSLDNQDGTRTVRTLAMGEITGTPTGPQIAALLRSTADSVEQEAQ